MVATVSISEIIGSVNGKAWCDRLGLVQSLVKTEALQPMQNSQEDDLSGQAVYASAPVQINGVKTNYDLVNTWQVNYVRGKCTPEGRLLTVWPECYNDDAMFGNFHFNRPGSKVLDVGCNTGKNMARALKYGGCDTEVFGLEFSADSVAVARELHGECHVFHGDASSNFVGKFKWDENFAVVQCTAVLQHMTPEQVDATLRNIAHCLKPGGELLLTFKDAPTKEQMDSFDMRHWADHIFTADLVDKEAYLRDGLVRAVMWDDDYYPGVTGTHPPEVRDLSIKGIHRREFVFYSLEWMKAVARKYNLFASEVEVMPDSKIPLSALHWMVIFRREPN